MADIEDLCPEPLPRFRYVSSTVCPMWFWIALGILCTFFIATVSIGMVTGSLARRPRRSVYDIEEAVEFVADRLPEDLTSVVSFEEVRAVLLFHCDYLADKGVASLATADDMGSALVVVPEDEPIAYVLGKVSDSDLQLNDEQVLQILDAESEYYRAIGAFGPMVDLPQDPST